MKKQRGYFPGVVSIEGLPLYIEGRNGNCNVKSAQLATHQRAFEALQEQGIHPKYARMDAGSYTTEVVNFFDQQQVSFFIRANQSQQLLTAASKVKEWESTEIGCQSIELASLSHLFGNNVHRIVAQRQVKHSKQIDVFTGDNYSYRFIITNDWQIKEKQAIEFYNARGASEKIFDIQNNDFNWKCMPHSFLEQNTVYLIIMAIAHLIYKWLLSIFAEKVEGLNPKARLKQFIFRFVAIVAKVTRSARQSIISIATDNPKLIMLLNSS